MVTVEFGDLKVWKPTKRECPIGCPVDMALGKMLGGHIPWIKVDLVKSSLQKIINEAYIENVQAVKDAVQFTLHPTLLYTKKGFKEGKLQLYPVGVVHLLKSEEKPKGVKLSFQGYEFQLLAYKALHEFEQEKQGSLVAYNWVQTTDKLDLINMEEKSKNVSGVSIHILVNSVALDKHTPLYRAQERDTKVEEGPAVPKAKRPKRA